MGLGIKKFITNWHLQAIQYNFDLRNSLFGFKNANNLLQVIDKRAIIPILNHHKASVSADCDFEPPLIFHNCYDYKRFTAGRKCHIGKNAFLDLSAEIILEDFTTVGMFTKLITHFDVAHSNLRSGFPTQRQGIRIGKNSFIGAGSTILHGVELGEQCMVAAGSVVTKSFPPRTLIGGIPAKAIKQIEIN
ncbi:MAG: acyltransferase [Candidatus Cyclobacteriaceae bacterium M3_2C_046]